MGVASNDNIGEGDQWTLIKCETVRQPKYVVDVFGRSKIKQIQTTALPGTYYGTPKYVVEVLRGAVSETYRRLPESRSYRHPVNRYSAESADYTYIL